MSQENDAVEKIIIYKGNRIKNNVEYQEYIKNVLEEHHIISSETSVQIVEDFVKVFRMGAVDGMTFDVGAALDFPEWKSRDKRREILKKKFLEE